MHELHYNKGRLFWVLLGGVAMATLCGWLAVTHPAPGPHAHGRYAALYRLIGPGGIELVFSVSALAFAAACVVLIVHLASDGVAARITGEGLMLNDVWGARTLPWREVRGFQQKVTRVRGRDLTTLIVHHAPRKVGPTTRERARLQHTNLLGDERDLAAWVEAAEQARLAPAAQPAPSAPRGFGRRRLA